MTEDLVRKLQDYNEGFDAEKLNKALKFLNDADLPLAWDRVKIMIPLKPDEDSILAVLLRDAYLDYKSVSAKELKNIFGHEVYSILSGVEKLEVLNYKEGDREAHLEILRKTFLAIAKDLRVIFVSLACRLVKLGHMKSFFRTNEERVFFSRETLDIYVPIAERLGMYKIKSRLEDTAFKYSNPAEYKNIYGQLTELRGSCSISIAFIKKQLEDFLESKGIDAKVFGRIKNIYSIYRKLERKGLNSVSELYDVFAIRIVLPAKTDKSGHEALDHLYGALGLIHGEWKPISKRFKDYLAVPKPNGYRSLHTVVLGLGPKNNDQPVEIQVRDENMHAEAEYGIASHWIYDSSSKKSHNVTSQAEWIRGLEQVRGNFTSERDDLKDIEVDVFKDRIFVLTPRGSVKDLPRGAVPIDFAYAVHTDIGNRCVMAKVNGSIVPLDHELVNGDVVEIITKKESTPKLQWLSVVKTGFAKSRIKTWFSALNKENNVREGRRLINAQLSRIGKPSMDQNYTILKKYNGESLSLSLRESLVGEVGRGSKLASDIIRSIYPYKDMISDAAISALAAERKRSVSLRKSVRLEDTVIVGGADGMPVKLASCCNPQKGDAIVGYITRGIRVTIHAAKCKILNSLDDDRIIFAEWRDAKKEKGPRYVVGIKVSAVGRVGLVRDVTSVISGMGVNIRDMALKVAKGGLSEEYYLLEFGDLDLFDQIIDRLENVKGVLKVVRSDRLKLGAL